MQGAVVARREAVDPLAMFFDPWWALAAPGRGGEVAVSVPAVAGIKVDVKEDAANFEVHADLPGFTKEEIKVEVGVDHTLHLSASHSDKKDERREEDGTRWHRVERSSAAVYRSLKLPLNADTTAIAASSKDGVLVVTIPKSHADAAGRRAVAVS